jgi:glucose-6-phosphate-specific signal transduction histidine kinase
MKPELWPRILLIAGVLGMLIGAVDPLEGSVVILAGSALTALAALLGGSRYRVLLGVSFVLVAAGVGAMFLLSGRSSLRWLAIGAYPIGWIMGLVGAVLMFRRARTE